VSNERERHQELMELFDRACDLPPAEQRAFVAEIMSRDRSLGERLLNLLHHDTKQTDILTRASGAAILAAELLTQSEVTVSSRKGTPKRIGAVVEGYVVGEPLGSGGLGTVHAARHRDTGEVVAIKFLRPHATLDPTHVKRLQREFSAIARLDHPSCVRVHAHGESHIGHYLVMEHVGGGDLRRLVGAPAALRLQALRDVAGALAHIHALGIVHRDLKPANVLLTTEDPPRPKLVDFGVAKVADASAIITDPHAVMGSIDYMSPEQLRGRADARSDLYALGCIIHELWCGEPPFTGDNFERLYARLKSAPPSLGERAPDAPPALVALTDRLVAREPAERPQTASEVVAVLDGLLRA
jgi:eukaryotic-like serine/threonine-protein kinase